MILVLLGDGMSGHGGEKLMLQTVEPSCVEELAQTVNPWQLSLRQLSRSDLRATISFAEVNDILVSNDRWRGHIHGNGASPDGYFTIVGSFDKCHIPWNGQVLEKNTLACSVSNAEWSFHTPDGTNHWVVFIPTRTLAQYLGREVHPLHGATSRLLRCAPQQFQRMAALVKQVLAGSQHKGRRPQALVAAQQLEDAILAEFVQRLPEFAADQAASNIRRRDAVYLEAIRYVDASGPPATVRALAAAVNVSVRVLQLAFRENLGQSACHFLHQCRLNLLHSKLRSSNLDETSVTELMSSCDLLQYGRVAGEYRRLFGELPSRTLFRQAGPPPVCLSNASARSTSPARNPIWFE